MIETKHLVEFIEEIVNYESVIPDIEDLYQEYVKEIVARLKELDDLKARLGDIKFPIFGEENNE